MSLGVSVSPHVLQALGWTLLHFLWQGALVAAVLKLALAAVPSRAASRRYVLSCAALAIATLLPLVTFALLYGAPPADRTALLRHEAASHGNIPSAQRVVPGPRATHAPLSAPATAPAAATDRSEPAPVSALRARIEPLFPQIVLVWCIGVCLFGLRLSAGWLRLQNLRFRYVRPVEQELRRRLEEIAASLGVHRPVWLLESAIAPVPTLVGWLRPTILLPAAALSGLPVQQLEVILAHELAHVRRNDYLVSLLQSLLEVLFFYHPATWWISARIREEREHACDDLAIEVMGNPIALGRALAALEQLRPDATVPPAPALAATGGSLYARVARLLLPEPDPASKRTPLPFVLLAAFVVPMLLPFTDPSAATANQSSASASEQEFIRRKQIVLNVQLSDVPLREALQPVADATGLAFELPPGAGDQRVSFEFEQVSSGMIIQSTFNLLEMDYAVDLERLSIRGSWWEGSGPRDAVRRLSLQRFHRRQEVFRMLRHEVNWGRTSPVTVAVALARLHELTGITFRYADEHADLAVPTGHETVTARDVINAIANIHNLEYRYTDDSEVEFLPNTPRP